MQDILLSEQGQKSINSHIRHTAQWQISSPVVDDVQHWDLLLVQWLEEVLYRSEIHNQWLVDCLISVAWSTSEAILSAQVSWVKSVAVEKEIEIKAVTSHELQFIELLENEVAQSSWESVPDFQGPGWFCDVVFDI
tara:strand:- start:362 stop:769 length:408 start_codon:yes stop_codon:yes gene_type:complete